MPNKAKKVTIETLQKFLDQEGKIRINKKTGEEYYEFSCPQCEEIGHDSDGNHLYFYPERGGFIQCQLKDKAVTPNEHGIKIYTQIKAELEREAK